MVSSEHYEDLKQFKWHAVRKKSQYYARRSFKDSDGKQAAEYMHRRIISALPGTIVDHISGDTLDNRIENIRIVTSRENCQNTHHPYSSVYPGVSLSNRGCKKWQSLIRVNGKQSRLGYFDSEIEAFDAYIKACIRLGFQVEFMIDKFVQKKA